MKTIYKSGNPTEAHIIAGLLGSQGIASRVEGEYLQGGMGGTAVMDFARVSIADGDYEAALLVITDYEQSNPDEQPDDFIDVSVDESENEVPIPPGAPSMRRFFTKPVLFWIALALLAHWFLF